MVTSSNKIKNKISADEFCQYGARQITEAVDRANADAAAFCQRTFEATDYSLWIEPEEDIVFLPQYPLLSLTRATGLSAVSMSLSNTNEKFSYNIIEGKIFLFVQGLASDSLTLSDYSTLDALGIAIAALAGKGWSYAVEDEDIPINLRPMFKGSETAAIDLDLQSPSGYSDVIIDDEASGVLKMFACYKKAFVQFRAGYETIPDDLCGIVTDYAISILRATPHDGTLKSEKIGKYSYTLNDEAMKDIFAPYREKLLRYKKRSV